MTPQEKAEELINKMFGLDLEDLTKFDYIDHVAAKHFSLVAVDEILKITEHESPSTYVYYMKVKQEIENL